MMATLNPMGLGPKGLGGEGLARARERGRGNLCMGAEAGAGGAAADAGSGTVAAWAGCTGWAAACVCILCDAGTGGKWIGGRMACPWGAVTWTAATAGCACRGRQEQVFEYAGNQVLGKMVGNVVVGNVVVGKESLTHLLSTQWGGMESALH